MLWFGSVVMMFMSLVGWLMCGLVGLMKDCFFILRCLFEVLV